MSVFSNYQIRWPLILLYLESAMLTVLAIVTLFSSQSWNSLLCFGIALFLGMQLVTVLWISHWAQVSLVPQQAGTLPVIATDETTGEAIGATTVEIGEIPRDKASGDDQQTELDKLRSRHSLAYDRYDGLGQSLTALNIQLQTALKLWETNPVQAQAFLVVAYEQGLAAMQEVRRTIPMFQVEVVAGDRSTTASMND